MRRVLWPVLGIVMFIALMLGILVPQVLTKNNETITIAAEPAKGFHWLYYLGIPSSASSMARDDQNVYLLVIPNNTGYPSDDQSVHEEAARKIVERRLGFARSLKVILLVPAFPRPLKYQEIYTHALDSGAITTDIPELKRLDLQLIYMIEDARKKLLLRSIKTEEKILMLGFSASGMFVNRFTILHPELIQAAAIGAPGGWPTVPIGEFHGVDLKYPTGVSDLERLVHKEFDIEAFRSVPIYFYMGEEDTNDCVPPANYMREDQRLIYVNMGTRPIERWPVAEGIYRSVECNSRFVSYPGVGHVITKEMLRDVKAFFLDNL